MAMEVAAAVVAEMRLDGEMVPLPLPMPRSANPVSKAAMAAAAAKPVGAGNKARKKAAMGTAGAGDKAKAASGDGDAAAKPAGAGKKMKTKRVMYQPEYVMSLIEKKAAREEKEARFSYTFPMILKCEGISDEQRAIAEMATSILKKTQDEDDEIIRQYLEEGEAYYEVVTYESE